MWKKKQREMERESLDFQSKNVSFAKKSSRKHWTEPKSKQVYFFMLFGALKNKKQSVHDHVDIYAMHFTDVETMAACRKYNRLSPHALRVFLLRTASKQPLLKASRTMQIEEGFG